MNKKYLILAAIILFLGVGMLLMPSQKATKQTDAQALLKAVDDPSRFLSPDEINDRLIKKDPTLLLVDVRDAAQFKAFAIQNAVNIPLDSLFTASADEILNQKVMDKVLYSNSDVTADQAWIICKRLGIASVYVMKGGINTWFNNLVKAEKPAETAPVEAIELYQLRMAASQYFFGRKEEIPDAAAVVAKPKQAVKVQKKPAAATSGGGC